MSPDRMSATSVVHKSTGGTLQSLPEPVDPVGDVPNYLTFKTVAPLPPMSLRCLGLSEEVNEITEYHAGFARSEGHRRFPAMSISNALFLLSCLLLRFRPPSERQWRGEKPNVTRYALQWIER